MHFPLVGSSIINGENFFFIIGSHACGFQGEGEDFIFHHTGHPVNTNWFLISEAFYSHYFASTGCPRSVQLVPEGCCRINPT